MRSMTSLLLTVACIIAIPLTSCYGLTGGHNCKAVNLTDERYNSPFYNALQQCGYTGYAMDCSGLGLTEVPTEYPIPTEFKPPMCILDLSNNAFTKLEKNAFKNVPTVKFLYLFKNVISSLGNGSFNGLKNLTYLNLSTNQLEWSDEKRTSISPGVFKPLRKLKWLNLNTNPITTFDELDSELQYLKSLEGLYIYGCEECKFGRHIRNLTRLRTLHFGANSDNECFMSNITNNLFENFVGLWIKTLTLIHCNLHTIHNTSLRPFNNSLVKLDLSYNKHLTFTGMNDALGGLANSTQLATLDAVRIHTQYERGTILERHHVQNLTSLKSLRNLNLDLNKLEVIDSEILSDQMLPKSLRKLTLAGNRLSRGSYEDYVRNVSGIQTLDLSRQHLYYDPFFHKHFIPTDLMAGQPDTRSSVLKRIPKPLPCNCSIEVSLCYRIYLPKGLQRVDWGSSLLHFEIPHTLVCNGEDLKFVNLTFNVIESLEGPVEGVSQVETLDLSYNTINHISEHFLVGFKSLKHLNLSYNFLGPSLVENGRRAFWNAANLQTLGLAYNRISYLHSDIFTNLTSLAYLNLHYNELDTWRIDISNSICLRRLDLSYNIYENVPESMQHNLDILSNSKCKTKDSMILNISRNPILCNCNTETFIKWLLQTNVKVSLRGVECTSQNGDRLKLQSPEDAHKILSELEKKCVDYGWLVATMTSVLGCLISSFITMFLYKKRWKLRHLYYSRRRRHRHLGYQRVFTYDAFVSYSGAVGSFVKNKMVPALEDERGLKLWVGDRNSHPGASIAENIAHAIYNSKKSINLIDKDYMNENWCDYEINMANMEAVDSKRNFMVFILMDDEHTNIPLNIMRLLDSEESLRYPHDGNQDEIDAFWTRLSYIVSSE